MGCGLPFVARPSMVVMLAPSAWEMGTRQLLTRTPSRSTEHAPHSPSPQPSFTPVSFKSSRSTSSSLCMGQASTVWTMPLTSSRTAVLGIRHLHCLHQDFRCGRNCSHAGSGSVLNRVQHGWSRSINWQFPNAFGPHWPIWIWSLFENHANRGHICCGGNYVVGHLAVFHPPFGPSHAFIQRVANALDDSTFDLSRSQQRMNHPPNFLHRDKIIHLNCTSCGIHAYFSNMNGPGERAVSVSAAPIFIPVNVRRHFILRLSL